jgi:hypothetical protein
MPYPYDNILPPVYGGLDPSMDPTQGGIPDDILLQQRMSQLFTPEHFATDRVNQLIQQLPAREEPSFMRKLSASLIAGGGNLRESQQVLDDPYNQKLQDWKTQFQPAYQAAGLERYNNQLGRQSARDFATNDIQNRKITETERHNIETEKTSQDKLEIARARAATYDYKARNPNHKIERDENGFLIGIDPQSNQMQYIIGPNGDPVKGDKLPQAELIKVNQSNALVRISATGNEQRKTENVREGNRETLEGIRQPNRIELKTTPSPNVSRGASSRPESEYQVSRGRVNRANMVMNERPDLAGYITFDNTGPTIQSPSSHLGGLYSTGPSAEDYKYLHDYIFGPQIGRSNTTSPNPTTAPPITPNGPKVQLPPDPKDRTVGMSWTFPNGKKGKWDGKGWVLQ